VLPIGGKHAIAILVTLATGVRHVYVRRSTVQRDFTTYFRTLGTSGKTGSNNCPGQCNSTAYAFGQDVDDLRTVENDTFKVYQEWNESGFDAFLVGPGSARRVAFPETLKQVLRANEWAPELLMTNVDIQEFNTQLFNGNITSQLVTVGSFLRPDIRPYGFNANHARIHGAGLLNPYYPFNTWTPGVYTLINTPRQVVESETQGQFSTDDARQWLTGKEAPLPNSVLAGLSVWDAPDESSYEEFTAEDGSIYYKENFKIGTPEIGDDTNGGSVEGWSDFPGGEIDLFYFWGDVGEYGNWATPNVFSDWGQPAYCRQQALALGFTPEDLQP